MALQITRRKFLVHSAAAAAVSIGAGGSWALAADDEAEDWAFPLLGDLHIDRPNHHDMEWLKREHPNSVPQVENYSRITREFTPKLLDVVRRQAAEADVRVPFIVQLGDLIQGLCGTESLAERQANDALDLIKQTELPVPLLFTKGNHDITGPGAAQVYDRILVPYMTKHAGEGIQAPAFTRRQGGTLMVFYDAYDRGSLDWFADLMRRQRPRRLLFLIHPPVVPYNARSTWHVYSSPSQTSQRQRLLELLGEAGAIVLCGHLHKYSYLVRRTEQGSFAQLAISSVANRSDAQPRDVLEGVKEYGPDLVRLEPRHSPETIERRRASLAEEQPFIEHFEYADTWGHALLRSRGGQLEASIFRGLERKAWKVVNLSNAPKRVR